MSIVLFQPHSPMTVHTVSRDLQRLILALLPDASTFDELLA
jgi:hypothetical protein